MPDIDEHIEDSKKANNNPNPNSNNNNNSTDAQTPNISSMAILRYSKDILLSLHDSPLVCIPENMPPLASWFGEEAGSPVVSKTMLNGSALSRSTDKSIVLGPSKTNFASSLYGGLKRTTEPNGTAPGASKTTSRLRQSEDSIRTPNSNHNGNINNNRIPRGPTYVGEKGFHHHHQHHHSRHEKTGAERRTSNSYGNQTVSQNKRFNQSDQQGERQCTNSSTSGGRRDFHREQRTGNRANHLNNNDMNRNGQDRVPEWMDYNPIDTKTTTDTEDKLESHGDFANDLEAWKSSMKKKEVSDNVPQNSTEEHLPRAQTNDTENQDSMNKIMDIESLGLTSSSTTLDNRAISSMTSGFNAAITPPDLPPKRGSRFAKFFAKREEESQVSSATTSPLAHEEHSLNDAQPKSINVNDLFQTSGAVPSVETGSGRVLTGNGPSAPSNVHVLSEEDLLQSMGAKRPMESSEPANQNAIGFNKVLQILSQPKPTAPVSPSSDANATLSPKINSVQIIEKQQLDYSNEVISTKETSPVYSPNTNHRSAYLNTEVSSPIASHAQSSTPTAKSKKVNQLFGGNLPTSVLRQMSVRSEGRSPSLSSNKSGHSGRFSHTTPNSQNGSPLNGHASPSSIHLPATTQQQNSPSQVYHGFPIRVADAQSNTTQVHHHPDFGLDGSSRAMMNNSDRIMMNGNSHDNDRMALPPQQHMFQNGEPGMPPPPIPPFSALHHHQHQVDPMNRMMSPPSSFNQQSQQQQQQALGNRPFMTHHHQHPPLPPPPSIIGMPGQHSMMSPHLSMRLQGTPANGLPPHPPPFMHQHPPPLMPGMPPPHPQPMGMGMPQHMYTSKPQGWNSQQ